MKRHQREMLLDILHGCACGVAIVVVGWLLLQWFRDVGGDLLGFGVAVMP